ncbi:uncharacterized protein LOC131215347 [Anopheles bellator]|uniref:uncharacterized protein LOC131215347 n=1 Tax=Anopheles bellator TaxID=139047 RepID=UPI00264832ED|nr:uncharacterized protein LOC131215347 [Anopheles bellator]
MWSAYLRKYMLRVNQSFMKRIVRTSHDEYSSKSSPESLTKQNKELSQKIPSARSIAAKYQIFQDEDSPIILDVDEERKMQHSGKTQTQPIADPFEMYEGIDFIRGEQYVFEIHDLVSILKLNNAINVFVCSVPKEIKYVDYLCIVSGRNKKHMLGIAQFVRKVYKMKQLPHEFIPKIEGESSSDWMALDLGNISLHIFSAKAREHYDLESLWTVGSEYDGECNKPNKGLVELFEKHTIYLKDLKTLEPRRSVSSSSSKVT